MDTAAQEEDTAIADFVIPNKFAPKNIMHNGHAYQRLNRTFWWLMWQWS
jgi:hypothetical protein